MDELCAELNVWLHLHNVNLSRPWLQAKHNFLTIHDYDLHTDSSFGAIGMALRFPNDMEFFDVRTYHFDQKLCTLNIHRKECFAILQALKIHEDRFRNTRVRISCDNTSVVASWSHFGTRDLVMNKMLQDIYNICERSNIKLQDSDYISVFCMIFTTFL